MEIICLDTSVLIEFYRNKDKSKSFWFQLAKTYQFSIPAIVKYEILRGDKKKDEFCFNESGSEPRPLRILNTKSIRIKTLRDFMIQSIKIRSKAIFFVLMMRGIAFRDQ